MIKVGITGGIGSGKSTVVEFLKYKGYPVFIADEVSKHILFSSNEIKKELIKRWGDSILLEGVLSKEKIAQKVFNNKEELEFLTSILHPKVGDAFLEFCKEQSSDIVFKEVAILFETGGQKDLDYSVLVSANDDLRIKRVIERDKTSEEAVKSRMKNQFSEEERLALADFVIKNENKELLIPQINNMLLKLKME